LQHQSFSERLFYFSVHFSSDDPETDDDEPHIESLSDFSTDLVLESVARFINAIESQTEDEEKEIPFQNVKPPPSMSAR
jgi:hypothetical protein